MGQLVRRLGQSAEAVATVRGYGWAPRGGWWYNAEANNWGYWAGDGSFINCSQRMRFDPRTGTVTPYYQSIFDPDYAACERAAAGVSAPAPAPTQTAPAPVYVAPAPAPVATYTTSVQATLPAAPAPAPLETFPAAPGGFALPDLSGIPTWAWVAGGAAVLLLVFRR